MDKVVAIRDVLDSWSNREIIEAWNNRCDDNNYSDHVYPMYMLNDIFLDGSFADNIDKFDHFDKDDDYFTFDDSTGLYNTISDIWEIVDIDELATYIYDYEKTFGDDDIEDILREED
jgi:hypothetical protein